MVVDLTAVDDRGPLVEKTRDGADEPGLALAAFAEKNQVMPGEQRSLEIWQDSVVEAHDAGEPRLSGTQTGQEILADLSLYRTVNMAARA